MVVMGKKLAVGIVLVVVIILVLYSTGILGPIISRVIKEPYLSVSETHGEDLYLRAEIRIHVTNDGGASASGVTVIVGSSGDSETKSLGDIAVGETKTAAFTFILLRGGDYVYHATATCLEGSSDSITFTVHVKGF